MDYGVAEIFMQSIAAFSLFKMDTTKLTEQISAHSVLVMMVVTLCSKLRTEKPDVLCMNGCF